MVVTEKHGLEVASQWGECRLLRCRYLCRGCAPSLSSRLDTGPDESGCSPEAPAQ